jgi:hypothetical protein
MGMHEQTADDHERSQRPHADFWSLLMCSELSNVMS